MAAFSIPGTQPTHMELDLQRAVFTQHSQSEQSGVKATQCWYAHRARPSLLIYEADISTQDQEFQLSVDNAAGPSSGDFTFGAPHIISLAGAGRVLLTVGQTTEAEQIDGPAVTIAIVSTLLPVDIGIPANTSSHSMLSITAIRTSLDAKDPAEAAQHDYVAAWAQRDSLRAEHEAAWAALWQHSVEVQGDVDLAQKVRSSWYYLLSSIRADVPHSLSPGGLATDTFSGHVFWDAEVWMYPNLAVFHPELAKACVQYRFDRLAQAHVKANQSGYRGAMFPWESASAGCEATPTAYETGTLEQHISADVSLSVKWLWEMARDADWLREVGAQLLFDIADFWASRAECGTAEDGTWSCNINGITGPDEYHNYVNNNVYTNVAAQMALHFAAHVHTNILRLGRAPQTWLDVADALPTAYDPVLLRHHEFSGYQGDKIKQADVVLLSYPLQYSMPREMVFPLRQFAIASGLVAPELRTPID
ncbi:hypothetical protein WJX72_005636 [[Myrmecia] bisecta]|uniref:Glycoside hydrolase family 65 central catalytic domain-containing protein n=1 Tax=[Myrmecia] bisecta TaxID=41462 RepID=A0AAW1R7M7_9CHLO